MTGRIAIMANRIRQLDMTSALLEAGVDLDSDISYFDDLSGPTSDIKYFENGQRSLLVLAKDLDDNELILLEALEDYFNVIDVSEERGKPLSERLKKVSERLPKMSEEDLGEIVSKSDVTRRDLGDLLGDSWYKECKNGYEHFGIAKAAYKIQQKYGLVLAITNNTKIGKQKEKVPVFDLIVYRDGTQKKVSLTDLTRRKDRKMALLLGYLTELGNMNQGLVDKSKYPSNLKTNWVGCSYNGIRTFIRTELDYGMFRQDLHNYRKENEKEVKAAYVLAA